MEVEETVEFGLEWRWVVVDRSRRGRRSSSGDGGGGGGCGGGGGFMVENPFGGFESGFATGGC